MRWLAGLLWLLLLSPTFAAEPKVPAFPLPHQYNLVNDYNGVLPQTVAQRILKKLRALQDHNGTQIVLLIVPSTGDEGPEAYSLRAAENWDIGNNRQGNGVLFLIDSRGPFYIRTGAGISGALPDVWLRRMIQTVIEPRWKAGKPVDAIEAGIDAMIQRAGGEETRAAVFGYDAFQPTWRHLTWAALGIIGLIYSAYSFAWRRFKRLPRIPIRVHGIVFLLIATASAGVALVPDPLSQLLIHPQKISARGGIQTLNLAREPRDLNSLSEPGTHTVLLLINSKDYEASSLPQNLKDFSSLRPDVAIRVAFLDYKNWNAGVLQRFYHQNIGMLPYFMIFDPDRRIVAADQEEDQTAGMLLSTWHEQEAQRFVQGQ